MSHDQRNLIRKTPITRIVLAKPTDQTKNLTYYDKYSQIILGSEQEATQNTQIKELQKQNELFRELLKEMSNEIDSKIMKKNPIQQKNDSDPQKKFEVLQKEQQINEQILQRLKKELVVLQKKTEKFSDPNYNYQQIEIQVNKLKEDIKILSKGLETQQRESHKQGKQIKNLDEQNGITPDIIEINKLDSEIKDLSTKNQLIEQKLLQLQSTYDKNTQNDRKNEEKLLEKEKEGQRLKIYDSDPVMDARYQKLLLEQENQFRIKRILDDQDKIQIKIITQEIQKQKNKIQQCDDFHNSHEMEVIQLRQKIQKISEILQNQGVAMTTTRNYTPQKKGFLITKDSKESRTRSITQRTESQSQIRTSTQYSTQQPQKSYSIQLGVNYDIFKNDKTLDVWIDLYEPLITDEEFFTGQKAKINYTQTLGKPYDKFFKKVQKQKTFEKLNQTQLVYNYSLGCKYKKFAQEVSNKFMNHQIKQKKNGKQKKLIGTTYHSISIGIQYKKFMKPPINAALKESLIDITNKYYATKPQVQKLRHFKKDIGKLYFFRPFLKLNLGQSYQQFISKLQEKVDMKVQLKYLYKEYKTNPPDANIKYEKQIGLSFQDFIKQNKSIKRQQKVKKDKLAIKQEDVDVNGKFKKVGKNYSVFAEEIQGQIKINLTIEKPKKVNKGEKIKDENKIKKTKPQIKYQNQIGVSYNDFMEF